MAATIAVDPASPAAKVHRWSAIDADTEEKIDRELRRPWSWRRALLHWLIEYNKY